MKIKEFILAPTKSQDTTSCGTTYSDQKADETQDLVSQNIVPDNAVSYTHLTLPTTPYV